MLKYIRQALRPGRTAVSVPHATLHRPAGFMPTLQQCWPPSDPRNVRWQFADIVPDYLLGRDTACLFLSLRCGTRCTIARAVGHRGGDVSGRMGGVVIVGALSHLANNAPVCRKLQDTTC